MIFSPHRRAQMFLMAITLMIFATALAACGGRHH
jgi:hypothetical protein